MAKFRIGASWTGLGADRQTVAVKIIEAEDLDEANDAAEDLLWNNVSCWAEEIASEQEAAPE